MHPIDDRPTIDQPASPDDLAAIADDPIIGTTLQDTYKVVRFLAEGGMGRVYEAQHTRITTKRFAIKVLLAELKHSLDTRLRFRREAEAAASVNHPNVVGVHDFGYAPDGRPYLVSDFLEGRELGEVLADKRPLPMPIAVSIAKQLCRALAAAHDRGVIHRDLKPANVFLVGPLAEPDVRVLDFGLARIVELTEAGVTQSGVVMGTPSYMSPEQAKGERADHRSDIYGVGAVLYTCLTGRPPHEEETAQQTVLAVMTREATRPCLLVPSLPPELEVVVQRAMAIDPAERFQSMRELEDALAPFLDAPASRRLASMPESSARPSLRVGPPDADDARGVRRRAVGWMTLAVVLGLVGCLSSILGGFFILWPGRTIQTSELLLVGVAVVGSLFTPGLLAVRWLGRRYWGNSARMLQLVATVRGPVLAGVFVYGVAALGARVLDGLRAHRLANVPAPDASGWLGWAPFLFGVALVVAAGSWARQRVLAPGRTPLRAVLAGPGVVGVCCAFVVALLFSGHRAAARHEVEVQKLAIASEPSAAPTVVEAAPTAAPSASASAAAPPPTALPPIGPADRAAPAEVEAASRAGVEGLAALQARFPRDPAVLLPLALALGKEPQRGSELLRVLDALFTEEPGAALDARLVPLIHGLALTPSTSQRAIDLMKDRMGLRGAEMLFDIVLAQPEVRPRAREALETSEVQRILSPALKVAFDLYVTPSCQGRVDLLPQVLRDGDERAIGVLTIFTLPTKRGCGPRKTWACPPQCAKEVPVFQSAVQQIKNRLAATKARP